MRHKCCPCLEQYPITFCPIASPVTWDDLHSAVGVAQLVNPPFAQRNNVVRLQRQWIKMVCVVVNVLLAPVAGWFAFGDDAAVAVSSRGVAGDGHER